ASVIKRQRRLPTGHGEVNLRKQPRIEKRPVQIAVRVVDAIAFTKRIEAVALSRMQLPCERERIKHARYGCDRARRSGRACQLRIEKADVKSRVVDHKFSIRNECE